MEARRRPPPNEEGGACFDAPGAVLAPATAKKCACMCTLRFQNAEITLRFQILDLSEAVALPTGVQTGGQRLARRRKRAHKNARKK